MIIYLLTLININNEITSLPIKKNARINIFDISTSKAN